MGSFTKNYYRVGSPNQFVTLTWDPGYKNVTLLDGKRVIAHWEKSHHFINGIFVQDEELGLIKIMFSDTRPIQLEVRINSKKYKPRKQGEAEFSVFGPKVVFWSMFISTVLYMLYILYEYRYLLEVYPEALNFFFFLFSFFASIYLFTAIMLVFKKYWAFFIGFGYLAVSTLWYLKNTIENFNPVFAAIVLIRIGIVVYLGFKIKTVIFAIRSKRNDTRNSNILDDPLQ